MDHDGLVVVDDNVQIAVAIEVGKGYPALFGPIRDRDDPAGAAAVDPKTEARPSTGRCAEEIGTAVVIQVANDAHGKGARNVRAEAAVTTAQAIVHFSSSPEQRP
jgi:hypothetical protein